MKFLTQAVVDALQLDDLNRGDLVELVVTGTLLDGTAFTSAGDCIWIVPPHANMTVTSSQTEVFVEVVPPDVYGNGGGITNFQRTYNPGAVTVTAPATFNGYDFVGWEIDGVRTGGGSGLGAENNVTNVPPETVSVTVTIWQTGDTTLTAVYSESKGSPVPAPSPTAGTR